MNEQSVNLAIGFFTVLTNLLIFMQFKKRHDIAMIERKNENELKQIETVKQNKIELEETRHKNQTSENEGFKLEINNLKLGISKMNRIMLETGEKIQTNTKALSDTQQKTDEYLKEFNDYKEWTFGRIQQIDSKLIEHDANFGKIILK